MAPKLWCASLNKVQVTALSLYQEACFVRHCAIASSPLWNSIYNVCSASDFGVVIELLTEELIIFIYNSHGTKIYKRIKGTNFFLTSQRYHHDSWSLAYSVLHSELRITQKRNKIYQDENYLTASPLFQQKHEIFHLPTSEEKPRTKVACSISDS